MDRRVLENHVDVLVSILLAYPIAWCTFYHFDNFIIALVVFLVVYLFATDALIYLYKKVKLWLKK